jgi:hypothetical protein
MPYDNHHVCRPNTYGFLGGALLLLTLSPISFALAPCQNKDVLPAATGTIVNVTTEAQLQSAVSNLQDNTTILVKPGTYALTNTLYIRKKNVTVRGDGTSCDQVILSGKGQENASYGNVPHGIWTDAQNLTVMNLTIKNVYNHGIVLNSGAQTPTINSVQILNSGQQFIKSNPTSYGVGVNNGVVKNSRFAYESSPPIADHGGGTGYTNGVDVHGGKNWLISGNRFENFHTPDNVANLWNPAILMWNGAGNTTAENNIFINVDRAIAFGLTERSEGYDHSGGIIRNNMVYYASGLFSTWRKTESDGAIIVWNSPNTVVAHNTVLGNGNVNKAVEFRFSTTTGAQAINNLVDSAIASRNSAVFSQSGNLTTATSSMFVNAASGNLRLVQSATSAINKTNKTTYASSDIDGAARGANGTVDIGAHEYGTAASTDSPPSAPTGLKVGS